MQKEENFLGKAPLSESTTDRVCEHCHIDNSIHTTIDGNSGSIVLSTGGGSREQEILDRLDRIEKILLRVLEKTE